MGRPSESFHTTQQLKDINPCSNTNPQETTTEKYGWENKNLHLTVTFCQDTNQHSERVGLAWLTRLGYHSYGDIKSVKYLFKHDACGDCSLPAATQSEVWTIHVRYCSRVRRDSPNALGWRIQIHRDLFVSNHQGQIFSFYFIPNCLNNPTAPYSLSGGYS